MSAPGPADPVAPAVPTAPTAPTAPRTPSLAGRLALAIALVLGAGGLAVAFAAFAYGSRAARETYDRMLLGAADQIAASTAVVDGAVVADIPASAFELLALAPDDRVFYRIVDGTGATLTGYDELRLPSGAGEAARWHDARFRGAPIRVVSLGRRFAERAYGGTIRVLVGHTLRARTALAREIAGGIVLTASLVGLCLTAFAVYAVHSALQPLRRIERGFAERDPRDLTPLDVALPRELRPVVDAINRFMARLDRQARATDNLIADSAHQLRTPVAALRAQAELATGESDPEAMRDALGRIHERTRSLSRLADQLLNRALVIHRSDTAMRATVDLRSVAIRTVEEFDLGNDDASSALRLALPEAAVLVRGDELSLCEACKNLVGNAFAHGVPPVTLTVAAVGARARLAVHDRGAGIPPEARARAGARFGGAGTRGPGHDSGHGSREGSNRGSGLGLAIVRDVAAAHDGELRLDDAERGGFEIGLLLPREPS